MAKQLAIGLMSGTSMDGIDAVLMETDGINHVKPIAYASLQYDLQFQIILKALEFAMARTHGDEKKVTTNFNTYLRECLADILEIRSVGEYQNQLCQYFSDKTNQPLTYENVTHYSTELHALLTKQLLANSKLNTKKIAVVGYHGQTLFHSASQHKTIQMGDGKQLASALKIKVVNDFRQNDIQNGGQGAPLAPVYHQALCIRDGFLPVGVINCGGIANLTIINGVKHQDLISFDTGPGNVLLDRFVRRHTQGNELCDLDGQYGRKGHVNQTLLQELCEKGCMQEGENFFLKKPPKSLDTHDFNFDTGLHQIGFEDGCATLAAYTAKTIVDSLGLLDGVAIPNHWIVVGGGWNNPVIKSLFESYLLQHVPNAVIKTAEEVGWQGQAVEAELIAYLAVRRLENLPISFPTTTGVKKPMVGGKINLS